MFVLQTAPVPLTSQTGQELKEGNPTKARREIAASLPYCGHKCDPLFCRI